MVTVFSNILQQEKICGLWRGMTPVSITNDRKLNEIIICFDFLMTFAIKKELWSYRDKFLFILNLALDYINTQTRFMRFIVHYTYLR